MPTWGHHRVFIEAKNSAGHDIMEFILIVVRNDIPVARLSRPNTWTSCFRPKVFAGSKNGSPHAMIDAQFEYLRKLVGHEPARDGKQIVKYQTRYGGGAHSGNPAMIGRGFWTSTDIDGWELGIWWHEVGHNFNAQGTNRLLLQHPGLVAHYHHHCHFLAGRCS